MPRWLFLTFAAAIVLAVFGSAFIALRGAPAKPSISEPAAAPR
ncbi:hypothetical protein AFCDBAGC_0932 [Methylobacterium cerastii]|uniref:Uncharacterized protein n=1 Tax=Methylobacterium cerastii TaxID=932741 RepID=A0ABQ4QD03_9HYPH|nr:MULTISPECIES: hypothetical protein [Methylobacterium]GJD43088.1 hypothetical protein AFCDBAGC_0932 [Methylobacterium cerastii]